MRSSTSIPRSLLSKNTWKVRNPLRNSPPRPTPMRNSLSKKWRTTRNPLPRPTLMINIQSLSKPSTLQAPPKSRNSLQLGVFLKRKQEKKKKKKVPPPFFNELNHCVIYLSKPRKQDSNNMYIAGYCQHPYGPSSRSCYYC